MKSIAMKVRFAGAALAAASTMAFGAVILNDDGTGWVGKGDVQLAFGWNNAQAQQFVNDVSFSIVQTSTYDATCTWTTGEGTRGEKTHNVAHTTSVAINSGVAYTARKTGQWTGYNLTGPGEVTTSGEVPVVGGPCMGNPGTDGLWSAVVETSSSAPELFVTFNGNSVALPETPVEPVL